MCMSAKRVPYQRETEKSFNGEEIRDSRVSFEIHRDYWQRRKTFVPVKEKTSFGARFIQGNPDDFQFYHALRKPDLLFPRHYDSQVTPLLSSSKLMKIKLSRRVGHECPDIFELWNSQTRDSVFPRKIVKDAKYIMINIIYINVMRNTHIYKVQDASVAWCKRDVTSSIHISNLMDRKYNNRCLILLPASLGCNDNLKKIRDKSGK